MLTVQGNIRRFAGKKIKFIFLSFFCNLDFGMAINLFCVFIALKIAN